MTNEEWFPHRRDDGEVVGYIRADGDLWCGLDILGRPVVESVEWLEAEDALEDRGLQMLLEPHVLVHEGRERRVRIVEVTPERVKVVDDEDRDANVIGAVHEVFTLSLPVGDRLR